MTDVNGASKPSDRESSGGSQMSKKKEAVRSGIGFGSALAIVISWSQHQSILWAVIHGALSWFYVIYHAITR